MTDSPLHTDKTTLEKHKEFLFPAVATYYKDPIALVKGQGMHVWDDQNNRYLDCFGGVLTVSVGHAHPTVTAAIVEQIQTLVHASALYANKPQSDLAEKLAQLSPGEMSKSFFTTSGTEANDTAIMAAKHATGRNDIVVLRHSYSGRSATTLSACGNSGWKHWPAQVTGFSHALAPYCYRCPLHLEYPSCGIACADDIEELIQTTTTGEIAAFMAETIMGVGGFIVPPPGYFEKAYEIARRYGGVCIADEVQTGWGRTGDHWFGIERSDVKPDIMVSAKGMGNGTPVAMTIATPEIADKYPGTTFATYGGNPVSMRAALAVIQVIEEENLRENARVTGDYLRHRLEELKEKHPSVGDVRGMGLMQGVELVKDRKTKEPHPHGVNALFEETKKRGVLIGKGGLYGNVIRTGMPLIASKSDVDELVKAMDAGLSLADEGCTPIDHHASVVELKSA